MSTRIITKKAIYKVLYDYWHECSKYKWQSIASLILPALGNIFVLYLPPLIVGKLINMFSSKGFVEINTEVITYLCLFAGSWILGEMLWRLGLHFVIYIETYGMENLINKGFSELLDRDYDFYANNFVGSIAKKTMAYSRNFETFCDTIIFNIFSQLVPFIFVSVILWRYSPWLPVILATCLGIVIWVAIPIIKKRSKLVALRHDAGSKVVGRISDSLTNILAIKSFAKEKQEYKIFSRYTKDNALKFRKAADYQNRVFDMAISPIYVFTNAVGLVAAIYFAKTAHLQPGSIVIIFTFYTQITRIFWDINRTYRNIESSLSESGEFTQLLLDDPKIKDVVGAKDLVVKKPNIVFSNVDFGYEDEKGQQKFLDNFNLEIKENERIGLVGPSGGGKTTITKLILRFIDNQKGSIAIDGQNIKEVTQASLRETISYVPQEPLLFHRTLFENIAYSKESATKEEVLRAAKLAHAEEFISKLPKGYDTLVGERGIKLSGGQRQRIAIARAILKNSPILVLDEATSALDSESEKYIQDGLWELMKGKTAVVIAHRLSTVKHLDRIIVLENGKVVQDGTHEELISQKGLYAKLWSHQTDALVEQ